MVNKTLDKEKLDIDGNIADATISDPTEKFAKPRQVNVSSHRPLSVTFHKSEYELSTIATAVELDGILNRSVAIYVEQIMKNGFEPVSKVDKVQKHIINRTKEIEFNTNITFDDTIESIARQLVTYGNAYLIKSRRRQSKYGQPYKLYNRTVNPIAGLFLADATTMEIGLNKYSKISYYRQTLNGKHRDYKVDDVIHFTYNKIPGTLTGKSAIVPVLDDVRALRKLEYELEILGFQYALPLYIYTVGTDAHPAAPTEIKEVTADINNMKTYGMMCVPGTHKVTSVKNENNIPILDYVNHFKKRIFSGLGVAPVAMADGDTSNRNTAQVSDMASQNITKSYQSIISRKIKLELYKEFILDSGTDPMRVDFQMLFPEIDQEAQIKKETHIIQKYTNNVISLKEARIDMGLEGTVDESDLYINNVQIPLVQAETDINTKGQIEVIHEQGKIQEKIAKIGNSNNSSSTTSKSKSNSGTKKSESAKKENTSKSKPTNQHGTSMGRPKYVKNSLTDITTNIRALSSIYIQDSSNIKPFVANTKKHIINSVESYIDETSKELKKAYNSSDAVIDKSYILHHINKDVDSILSTASTRIQRCGINDSRINYIIKLITDNINYEDKISNMIKAYIFKHNGDTVLLSSSDDCKNHYDIQISLDDISYKNIPPYDNNCKCILRVDQ